MKIMGYPICPPLPQVTITIAFYAGVALIDAGCGGTESNWCNGVSLLEYAVRSLIMLSTVVAINFNITHIRFCIQVCRCPREGGVMCYVCFANLRCIWRAILLLEN